ncbi:MAG: cyclopropane-fatty-acyl-phospholipid synthase family protein [Planctomycetes bacterium]|nr:cyclopropane-fatty-acyl-phospholipid synthase family protein [Planctomycetota bacterium]
MSTPIQLAERGLVPEFAIRWGIRRLLRDRIREETARLSSGRELALQNWVEQMRSSQVALHTGAANEQHYEVPPDFFEECLGGHLKYSSCYYTTGHESLTEAEAAMLALTSERARLANGLDILELGCGWGSLSLWMAKHYPMSRITSVSNSAPQREFIAARAAERGLTNLQVITADANTFEPDSTYDRIVSVEMFEHMRNWEQLLGRAYGWLRAGGKMFLHVFSHKSYCYPFEVEGDNNWMGRSFFTGGMMPSHDLLDHLDIPFELEERWEINGRHYAQTSEHWLENLNNCRTKLMPVLANTYGPENAKRWFHRWRIFFLACAELFAYDQGNAWQVTHHLLKK